MKCKSHSVLSVAGNAGMGHLLDILIIRLRVVRPRLARRPDPYIIGWFPCSCYWPANCSQAQRS